MYARLVRFPATSGKRVIVEKMAEDVYAKARTLPGFIRATYMFSEEENEYVSLTLWSEREHAENGTKVIGREFGMKLADLASGPVEMTIMEVFKTAEK